MIQKWYTRSAVPLVAKDYRDVIQVQENLKTEIENALNGIAKGSFRHLVDAAEAGAGQVILDTGWGVAPTGAILVQVVDAAGAIIATMDLTVTIMGGANLGKVQLANTGGGAYTLVAGHTINMFVVA